jgi:hypothetical protein
MGVITKVRGTIDKAVDALIAWVVKMAKTLFAKVFGKGDKPDDRSDAQKATDVAAAIAAAESLLDNQDTDTESVRRQLPTIKAKYRLSTLDLIVDSETKDETVVHVHGEASPGKDGSRKRRKKGAVGPLQITRKSLSFTADTKRFLIAKFKSVFPKGQLGQFKSAKLDIRHKISISDAIKHLDTCISPMTVEEAAAELAKMGFPPQRKGRPGIIEACRTHLQAANNDTSNLSIGARGANRRIQQRYDPGDDPGADPRAKKHDSQKKSFIEAWGVSGSDFKITIDITDDGVEVETWEISE